MMAVARGFHPQCFFNSLVTILAQGFGNRLDHASVQNRQSTQIASPLGAHSDVPVAFTAGAVNDFPGSGDAETLLGALMGLHFVRHEVTVM
jgi:hypothetical protein